MQVQVLGAGCDVGRSCLHLSFSGANLLLDCGAHPGFADARRFPDFKSLGSQLSSLDAILISHFHFDHAAALPLLTETLQCQAPLYMTEPTRDLAQLMLSDFISTSASRRQHCPFSKADARNCLSRVRLLRLGQTTAIQGKSTEISVTPYYSGHVLGAVMLYVRVGSTSVLYSGDYSTRPDRHLRAANVPFGLEPDLFITEATYCSTVRREGRRAQEDALMNAVTEAVCNEGKVLVPISAFGRVHAVCALFASHPDADLLKNVPLYVVSGLASKAITSYERHTDWTANTKKGDSTRTDASLLNDGVEQQATLACDPFISRLKTFNRNEHWGMLEAPGSMILFATPGNMSTGLSLDAFREWASDSRNTVVVPGFCFANTFASKLISGHSVEGHSSEINCRLVNMMFGSHADARGIVRTCRKVKARAVMLVHGDRDKVTQFRQQLSDALEVPCFAPANGDTVVISMSSLCPSPCRLSASLEDEAIGSGIPDEWLTVINEYTKQAAELSISKR